VNCRRLRPRIAFALWPVPAESSSPACPARQGFSRFADLLEGGDDAVATARRPRAATIDRPIGSQGFLAALEAKARRPPHPLERGPEPRGDRADATE
jgi:hypothetical protein